MRYISLFFIFFSLSVLNIGCGINFFQSSGKQKSEQNENEDEDEETEPRNKQVAKAIKDNTIADMLINEKAFFDKVQQYSNYPTGDKNIRGTYFYLAAKYLDEKQITDFFRYYNTKLPLDEIGAQSLAYMGISPKSLETIDNVHGITAEKLKEIFFIPKYDFANLLDKFDEQENIIKTFQFNDSASQEEIHSKNKKFNAFRNGIVAEAIKQRKLKEFLLNSYAYHNENKGFHQVYFLYYFGGKPYSAYPTGNPNIPFGDLKHIASRYLNKEDIKEVFKIAFHKDLPEKVDALPTYAATLRNIQNIHGISGDDMVKLFYELKP